MAKFIGQYVSASKDIFEPAQSCDLSERWPALWEYLTVATWSDGKPRKTSTINISLVEGRILVWLNDKAMARSLPYSGRSLAEALDGIEEQLRSGDGDWRADRRKPSRGPRGTVD